MQMKNLKSRHLMFLSLLIVSFALTPMFACGSKGPKPTGEEKVVETSRPDKAEWMGKPTCPEGRVCAQGSRTHSKKLEHGKTDAHHAALKQFANDLQTKVKSLYEAGRQEDGGDSGVLTEAYKELYAAASKLNISNVKLEDFWWRKLKVLEGDQEYHYYYDYFILVSISEASWKKQVQALIDAAKKKAGEANQQELVDAMDDFAKGIFEEE